MPPEKIIHLSVEKDSDKFNNQCKTKKMQTKTNSPSDSNKNKVVYV